MHPMERGQDCSLAAPPQIKLKKNTGFVEKMISQVPGDLSFS